MLGYFHSECSLFLNFIAKIERLNSFSAFKINRNVQRGVLFNKAEMVADIERISDNAYKRAKELYESQNRELQKKLERYMMPSTLCSYQGAANSEYTGGKCQ